MTLEERETIIEKLLTDIQELRLKKGADYSIDDNCMANLHRGGWKGIILRMGDKMTRLEGFAKKETFAIPEESLEDNLKDMVNYSLFALIEFFDLKA